MQFTSPLFIFVFLPMFSIALSLLPKKWRKYGILVCGLLFFTLVNIKSPLNLLLLIVTTAFGYCASHAVFVSRKKSVLVFCTAISVLMLAFIRFYGEFLSKFGSYFYTFGASIYFLSLISLIIDVWRGDADPPESFFDALLYIGFFPIMLTGPLIKYKDFIRLTTDEYDFSLNNVADGFLLFAIGFIKRIGVSAIMAEIYTKMVEQISKESTDLSISVMLFLIFVWLINVFFTFSGYSDMGRGLALIMGIKLAPDFGHPLLCCSPAEYIRSFLISYSKFMEDYLSKPLISFSKGKGFLKVGAFVSEAITVICFALWMRASVNMLTVFLPMIIWAAFERAYRVEKSEFFSKTGIRRNLALRTVGRLLTLFLFSVFWIQIKAGSISTVISYFKRLTVIGSYQSYKLYLIILNRELIFVALAILIITLPMWFSDFYLKHCSKAKTVFACCHRLLIIALFVFCIFFVLPQYPEYAIEPFSRFLLE